jgi:hypothetical protein
MDIVERLARQTAETINGGEFNNGKWYTEGQRQAWRKAMTPAAYEIELLQKVNEQLRSQMVLFDPNTTQEMAAAALNFANDAIGQLQGRNHSLRERVELLEGYLNGALNLVENFAHCDTTDARKALEGKS